MEKPRIVAVLGMHRSGTSLITRGLKTLSVDLGNNLMPAAVDQNEKGFWEDLDIYDLNQRVLGKWGSGWSQLSAEDKHLLVRDALSEERYEATRLLQSKLSIAPIFGFKDPRTTILLDFWKRVFENVETEPSYVIAVRNPLEVAASLTRRNGFETAYGITLWLKYTIAAIEGSAGARRVFVSYANMLTEPVAELTRIATALGLPQPQPSSPDFVEYVGEFVSQDLRHNRISDNEVSRYEQAPALLSDLYKSLLEWCHAEAGTDLRLPKDLHQAWNSFQASSRMLLSLGDQLQISLSQSHARAKAAEEARTDCARLVEQKKTESEEQAAQLALREAEIASLKRQLDDEAAAHIQKKTESEVKAAEVQRLQNELENAHATLASRESEIAEQAARLALGEAEIASLKRRLDDEAAAHIKIQTDTKSQLAERDRKFSALETQNQHLEIQWREEKARATASQQSIEITLQAMYKRLSSEKLAELSARLTSCDAALEEMKTSLRLARHESHAFRTSTSWKLTRPLRAVARFFSRLLRVVQPRSATRTNRPRTKQ